MADPTRAGLCVAVLVLASALAGCAADGAPGGPAAPSGDSGKSSGRETPCPAVPSPSGPSRGAEPTPGAPGDSREHSLAPGDDCIIESGIPTMPVQP